MDVNRNLRRDFLKKMLACSSLPMVGGSVLSLASFQKVYAESTPANVNNRLRVAVFGSVCGGAHTYANILKRSLEIQDSDYRWFDDTACMPHSSKEKWNLFDHSNDTNTAKAQITEFRKIAIDVEQKDLNAVFSFRMPYPENSQEMVETLKRLNYQIVFIEPKDMLRTAGTWSLLVNSFDGGRQSTLPWDKAQVNWKQEPVTIVKDIVVSTFAKRIQNLRHCQELIGDLPILRLGQGDELSIAKKFLGDHYKSVWRDLSIKGDVLDHIKNRQEVEGWLKSSKII